MTTTVAMTNPVVTQVISSTVAPSEPDRCGVATATIEVSMAPINVPKVTERVTNHLLTGARAGAYAKVPAAALTTAPPRHGERRPAADRPPPPAPCSGPGRGGA